MAKLTKKRFLSLSASEIGKLKEPALRELLRGARNLYNAQEEKFERVSHNTYSFALDKMQDYYENNPEQALSRMSMSKMRNELFRLQEFFDSETSTIPGARRVAAEANRRIFGVNARTGGPAYKMTMQESIDFWAAYHEFINMEKESYVRNMGSNTIQQYLGQMIIQKRKGDGSSFSMTDFQALKTRLEEQKNSEEWEVANYGYEDNDIFSGKRSY